MNQRSILLLNAGSSSLKCALMDVDNESALVSASAEWSDGTTRCRWRTATGSRVETTVPWQGHSDAVHNLIPDLVVPWLSDDSINLVAIGHRVVHGGDFTTAVQLTAEVRSRIEALSDLAPLHNPPSLATLAAAELQFPSVAHYAVFDTSFHSTLSQSARRYAIPRVWTEQWGMRKYGFHGLSHEYCSIRATEMLPSSIERPRIVICHLGHGCSASAVVGGKCIDTTMGFTPLDGLMMATRCGAIDASLILQAQLHHGLSAKEIETALNSHSGLLGVSEVSSDMRQVQAAANAANAKAQLAIDMYVDRIREVIGSFAVTMGGIDCLVFTAGVGENSAAIRAAVCRDLEFLGIEINAHANNAARLDCDIATDESQCRIFVIATREDITMLRQIRRAMQTQDATQLNAV